MNIKKKKAFPIFFSDVINENNYVCRFKNNNRINIVIMLINTININKRACLDVITFNY